MQKGNMIKADVLKASSSFKAKSYQELKLTKMSFKHSKSKIPHITLF